MNKFRVLGRIAYGLLLGVLVAGTALPAVRGQVPSTNPVAPAEGLTSDALQAKITAVTADKTLADDVRAQALTWYQAAQKALAQAQDDTRQAAVYQEVIQNGAAHAAAIRQALAAAPAPATEPAPSAATTAASQPSRLSVKELNQRLTAVIATLTTLKSAAADFDKQLKDLRENPTAAAEELAAAQRAYEQWQQTPAPAQTDPVLATAQETLRQVQQRAQAAHVHLLELKQASVSVRQDLLGAQGKQAAARVAATSAAARQLNAQLIARQRADAQEAAAEAQRAQGEEPAVRQVALDNARLSRQAVELADQTEQVTLQLRAAAAMSAQINQNYELTKGQLQLEGVGRDLAEVLRHQRHQLPSAEQDLHTIAAVHTQINQARLGQLQINQEDQNLADVDRRAAQILAEQVTVDISPAQRAALLARVTTLLTAQRTLLDNLTDGYSHYLMLLTALDQRQQKVAQVAADFARLLDAHLLWMPSAAPAGPAWLGAIARAGGWLADPTAWRAVGPALGQRAEERPLQVALALLVFLGLLLGKRRLVAQLEDLGRHAGQTQDDGLSLTLRALVLTLVTALPGPLFVWVCASLLQHATETTDFVRSVGVGLDRAATLWFYLAVLRQACRPQGLVQAHFRWDEAVRQVLRHNVSWLLPLYVPLIFLIDTTHANPDDEYANGIGRLAFVALSVALALFLRRVLHPRTGVLTPVLAGRSATLTWSFQRVWYPLAVATPLLLGAAALAGYYYAALMVEGRLFQSVGLVVLVVLLYNLVVRWLGLAQRQLHQLQAQEQRAVDQSTRAGKQAAESAGQGAPVALAVPQVDLLTINAQTRAFVTLAAWVTVVVGLWRIWVNLLPALRFLDTVTLWQHTVDTPAGPALESVTLASLGLAVLLALLTVVATRNVTGVLEILLLQRLALDAGVRYAINRIASYLIITVGTVATFHALGVGWSEVQWLAAAFSVGLGFGLQEIFANFISGLILLFERPIRVGDIVTVDGLSGTVARIRMRATTITDWDNKEIIMPNKTFITGRVINWTLSDSITRLVIKVGVAPGSDTRLTEKLLLETAQAHPHVLKDPAPTVFFTDFGASLSFELRLFVKEPAQQMPVTNDLHLALEQAFRKNGISVP